eukprot:m.6014 g.6014  ORF g.6014 m.6014 type:complete len:545 (+) comp3464_c0_seq1:13-1647(+)
MAVTTDNQTKKKEPSKPVKSVKIVDTTPDGDGNELVLLEAATKILTSKEVADKPVVVISVAGPFRLGKSFLLNFLLRYLYHEGDADKWLEDEKLSLDKDTAMFTWAHGPERNTTGIWMLEKPIIKKLPTGKEVAILLVDTQGTFDNKTTSEKNAMIFALNALLSSHQIYNISMRIGEDQLQHMHLFTKFGQMVAENSTSDTSQKPFQSLQFLIRDWQNKAVHPFGAEGGESYLKEVLKVSDEECNKELREVREDIQNCFQKLACFLMPHPGYQVAEGDSADEGAFSGSLKEIRPAFLEQIKSLAPMVLAPENLAIKRVLGEEVTCAGLLEYLKVYVKEFSSGTLPSVTSVFDATSRVNHLNIKNDVLTAFKGEISKLTGPGSAYREDDLLKKEIQKLKDEALKGYKDTPKLNNKKIEEELLMSLDEETEKLYKEAMLVNEDKSIFKVVMTPFVLMALSMLASIVQQLSRFIGIGIFDALFGWVIYMSFLATVFSIFCKYSGKFPDQAKKLDSVAQQMQQVFKENATKYIMDQAMASGPASKKNK